MPPQEVEAKLLAAAVNFSEDSIVITDTLLDEPGPRIVYVNPAFTKMTGYTSDEVIGKNPRFLQGPKTDGEVLKRLRRNLEEGEIFQGCSVNYKKDGSEFWIEWHIEPIKDDAGNVTHYLAIQRDITDRVLKDQRFQEQFTALEAKTTALREVLESIELEKKKIKDDILLNIEEVIVPLVKKLRRKGGRIDKQYLDILENSLKDISSSFGMTVSEKRYKLSPREVEIANMIKNGLSNKEISNTLNISIKTVETHRNKIRRKFGVVNQDVNLISYLQAL